MGLDHLTGEIAVGKAADSLIVDVDTPEMSTSVDLTWDLVRLGNRDQITAVFVAGRLRLWEGWPPDWDARALQHRLARVAHAAMDRAPIVRLHPTATEHHRLSVASATSTRKSQ